MEGSFFNFFLLRTFSSSFSLPESFTVDPPVLAGFYLETEEDEEK